MKSLLLSAALLFTESIDASEGSNLITQLMDISQIQAVIEAKDEEQLSKFFEKETGVSSQQAYDTSKKTVVIATYGDHDTLEKMTQGIMAAVCAHKYGESAESMKDLFEALKTDDAKAIAQAKELIIKRQKKGATKSTPTKHHSSGQRAVPLIAAFVVILYVANFV